MGMDITSIGSKITLIDLVYPQGVTITEAPGEGTFFSFNNTTIRNVNVGLNGHQYSNGIPNVISFDITVIPNSEDDVILQAIASYVRPQGVTANFDSINVSITESNGNTTVLGDFEMTDAPFGNTANADGSFGMKTYSFAGVTKVA